MYASFLKNSSSLLLEYKTLYDNVPVYFSGLISYCSLPGLFIYLLIYNIISIFNPHLRIYLLIPEREGRGEREREREKHWCERNIDRLLSTHVLTRDWICSLGMCLDRISSLWTFGFMGQNSNYLSHTNQGLAFLFYLKLPKFFPHPPTLP